MFFLNYIVRNDFLVLDEATFLKMKHKMNAIREGDKSVNKREREKSKEIDGNRELRDKHGERRTNILRDSRFWANTLRAPSPFGR